MDAQTWMRIRGCWRETVDMGAGMLLPIAATGRTALEVAAAERVSVARQTIEKMHPFAEEHGVRLELRAPTEALVRGDADRLLQVFTNLLSSAIRYRPLEARSTRLSQPKIQSS